MTEKDKIERHLRDSEPVVWWNYQPCPNCGFVGEMDLHFRAYPALQGWIGKCNHCQSPVAMIETKS